ncbi:RNAseH domain-containing protein [Streptomyces spororaveus]|uniref:RNaseH domain-containing protein n=1 Tax=Streptomyces spororaveus TaxID=284039 RepID=UPI00207ADA33|nr:RNaseH domain-containing protein [Streptomyces spororaveus]MCM9082405.1 RNAseH domain-containing protein [Streptomyces spororaveus]
MTGQAVVLAAGQFGDREHGAQRAGEGGHVDDEQDAGPRGAAEQVLDSVETTRTLYQVTTDFGLPTWILCNVPRGYDGDGAARLGSKYTRSNAKRSVHSEKKEERRKGELPENGYSMTGTEIYPIACSEGDSEEPLAVATAKLCHQTLFWSDRARFPVPLHAAKQMDLDHPQYRRRAPPEEKPTAEPGSADPTTSTEE